VRQARDVARLQEVEVRVGEGPLDVLRALILPRFMLRATIRAGCK
jgi:hypothetical protein